MRHDWWTDDHTVFKLVCNVACRNATVEEWDSEKVTSQGHKVKVSFSRQTLQ